MDETYPLPLNSLRYFLWAARLGSFKLAAEKLFISEAAVSQQIRNLESTLGVKLFIRTHQKVSLTAFGEKLLPFIEAGFSSILQGISRVAEDPRPNRLSISTMPSLATHWLIHRLNLFNQLHPEISIMMDTSLEISQFEKNDLDLAIRYGQGSYAGLKSELLLEDPTVLVCSPKRLGGDKITRADIVSIPLVVGVTDGIKGAVNDLKTAYQVSDSELNEVLVLKDGSLGAEAARSGQGLSMQRLSLVAGMIQAGELVFAEDFAFREYNLYAVAPAEHFTKAKVKKFLAWLRSEMDKTRLAIKPLMDKLKT